MITINFMKECLTLLKCKTYKINQGDKNKKIIGGIIMGLFDKFKRKNHKRADPAMRECMSSWNKKTSSLKTVHYKCPECGYETEVPGADKFIEDGKDIDVPSVFLAGIVASAMKPECEKCGSEMDVKYIKKSLEEV
jgi:hypothetical protein